MRKLKIIILGICIMLLAIVISACAPRAYSGPRIELSTYSFDLGDIDPDDGNRVETFFIKNTGISELTITGISTSCGCTEAEVESEKIAPGDQSKLTITYDPSVHPGLVGKIKRIVYIKSNDPNDEEIELELIGNSLPSESEKTAELESSEDDHDEALEGLLEDFEISPTRLYNKIKNKESFKLVDIREDFEYEQNHIKDTLLLSLNSISQAELDKLGLKKDDELVLYGRSGRRSAKAYEILIALGYTNVMSLYGGIVHWTEEEYPVEQGNLLKKEQSAKIDKESGSPAASFNRVEHDFGEIPQFGGVVNTVFELSNTGDSDLKITSISTSCACATAELDELVVFPGESTNLNVIFDPDFHAEPEDRFSRTIFLETNDPNNPEIEVKLWVDILEGK